MGRFSPARSEISEWALRPEIDLFELKYIFMNIISFINNFENLIKSFTELKSAQCDRDTMKEQAEGLQREYDRVCEQLANLEVAIYLFCALIFIILLLLPYKRIPIIKEF